MAKSFQDCAVVYSHYYQQKKILDSHFTSRARNIANVMQELTYICNHYRDQNLCYKVSSADVLNIKGLADKALMLEYDECVARLEKERQMVLYNVHNTLDEEEYDYYGFIQFLFIVMLILGGFYCFVYGASITVSSVYVGLLFVQSVY